MKLFRILVNKLNFKLFSALEKNKSIQSVCGPGIIIYYSQQVKNNEKKEKELKIE